MMDSRSGAAGIGVMVVVVPPAFGFLILTLATSGAPCGCIKRLRGDFDEIPKPFSKRHFLEQRAVETRMCCLPRNGLVAANESGEMRE